ncbi:bone sialoprotein-binding protein, partial [Staphylococcus warneri L37603]
TTKETPTTTDQTPESNQTDSQETTTDQVSQPTTQTQNSPEAKTTQEFDTVVNDVQNASTNEDKQEALTNYIADTNNTSKEDAKAQVENLDLDYNNLDEDTLVGALAQDYSNKKDSESTYATPRTTEATPLRVANRMSVNALAAEATGKNVNDLITVTNQSITEGQKADKIISAHDGENIVYNSDMAIDDQVNSGDTMTIDYDPHMIPSDLTNDYSVPDLVDAAGDVVATGTFDENTKRATYTFTDYVNTHNNVSASLSLSSYIDKATVPNRNTDLDLTFKTANTPYSDQFRVTYQDPIVEGDSNIQSIFTNLDTNNKTVEQTVYVNPLRNTANNTEVVIDGNGQTGHTIIDGDTEIKIYRVGANQELPDSNRIYDYSKYEDVTDQFPIDINSNNQATINFGDIDTPYIIKVVSKYDEEPDGKVNAQQLVHMITENKFNGTDDTASYGNNITFSESNGNANGDDIDSDADADS